MFLPLRGERAGQQAALEQLVARMDTCQERMKLQYTGRGHGVLPSPTAGLASKPGQLPPCQADPRAGW